MKVAFTYTFMEFVDGIQNTSWLMRFTTIFSLVSVGLGLGLLLLLHWLHKEGDPPIDFAGYLPFLAIIAFWSLFPIFQAWLSWHGNPNVRGKVMFDANEEGTRIQTENTDAFCKWETFVKYKETRRLFLLFPSKRMCHILPKRAFTSATDIQTFRELAQLKIKK